MPIKQPKMSAQPQIKKARTERMIVYDNQINKRWKLSPELSEAKGKTQWVRASCRGLTS